LIRISSLQRKKGLKGKLLQLREFSWPKSGVSHHLLLFLLVIKYIVVLADLSAYF